MTTRTLTKILLAAAAAALLAACGGGGDEQAAQAHALLGRPADPGAADRTIEVTAGDPYSFSPAEIEVAAGETVLFRVTNEGHSLHEFVLGPEDAHVHGEDGDTAIQVMGGETEELAWTFTEAGSMDFNCFVPGHSEAGMKGTITVSG